MVLWHCSLSYKFGYGYVTLSAVVDCGNLKDPENGQVTLSGTDFGSRARYRCFPGHTLQGDTTRVCEFDRFWTGEAPICVCK